MAGKKTAENIKTADFYLTMFLALSEVVTTDIYIHNIYIDT